MSKFTGVRPNKIKEMKIATIIDWILTEKCNLNCYYCLQNADTRMAKCTPVDYRFAQKVEFPMLFHLTGGEPFLVPNLINLINELQAMGHYVSMNTNLTHSTRDFSKLVDKEHFLFINSSYHYIYRKELINPFIRNYMYLREAGIFTYATIVMLPDLFDDLLSVADKLISNGVCVLPKLMRGRENGKQYPQDYDNTQLERMSALLDKSKANLSSEDKSHLDQACLYNVSIDDWQMGSHSIGTRCFDGLHYIRITETGDVIYCNGLSMGNVYHENFQFQFCDTKRDCPYKTGNYLCKKNY